MTTFSEAYAAQREQLQTHVVRKERKRKPVLAVLATLLGGVFGLLTGRASLWYARARRPVMYLAGFGFIDYAAWSWNHILGYAFIGVSLLVLDALSGGDA